MEINLHYSKKFCTFARNFACDYQTRLDEQIEEAEEEYNVVNPFYGMGGARIDDIDYEYKKRGQAQNIAALKQKRKAINKQIDLINSFLRRK